MEKKDKWGAARTLTFGLLALILGGMVINNGANLTELAFDLLALYFEILGLGHIFFRLILRRKDNSYRKGIFNLLLGQIVAFFNHISGFSVGTVLLILGAYQVITAAIFGITYFLYRKNKVQGGGRYLLDTFLYGFLGLSTIFYPSRDGDLQFLFLGIYLILLGISNIRDGLFFDVDREQKLLRRRIRINLPIIVVAFIPAEQLSRFNQFLKGEDLATEPVYSRIKDPDKTSDLEVLVHTSDQSLFGAIGHVDICYKGKVISYGSYDVFSERLFGTIGDGVLFKVDKETYIELCKKESRKTLFGYSLFLNDEQKAAIERRLAEIDQLLEDWNPSDQLYNGELTYAYKLKHDLGAKLYKFKSSRFKTYFVLSTNCCLLADSIIGEAGTAMLDMRGIITPGTYQSYLQYEFESANSLVIAQHIYQ